VPLTDVEYELVRQRFASKTTGTMYDPSAPANPMITLEQRLNGQR
jgi:hypothetical protein